MPGEAESIESLTSEMQLTRHEMGALTDAMTRLSHCMKESTAATNHLTETILESRERGFWRRLLG